MKKMSDVNNENNIIVRDVSPEVDSLPYPTEAEIEEKKQKEDAKAAKKKSEKNSVMYELLDWLKTICIGVGVGVLLVVFVIQRNDVSGDSMFPTLHDEDVIFAEKISTYFESYDRGDIVILDGDDMEGYSHDEYLVKRIVGLPGETIRIGDDGCVYIKKPGETEFTLLDEPYLPEGTLTFPSGTCVAKGYDEITLGEDQYYCLGDNRSVSNDSRNLGPFEERRIKGVGMILAYPFSSFRFL